MPEIIKTELTLTELLQN